MTTLATLIVDVVEGRRLMYDETFDGSDKDRPEQALCDWCVAHAADIAERERLECAVVEARRECERLFHADYDGKRPPYLIDVDGVRSAAGRVLDGAETALADYLVAHAETKDATADDDGGR